MGEIGQSIRVPSSLDVFRRAADRLYRQLMRHRERYVKAWIAATGLHPTECELVHEMRPDGSVVLYVRKRQ